MNNVQVAMTFSEDIFVVGSPHLKHFISDFLESMSRMLVILSLIAVSINVIYAAGGVAELKALTGDAPYLGFGNQEQAPEYFGDAMVRQYYQNPSYGYAPRNPYSNYNYRAAYAPYRQPMYPGGGFYPGGKR